MLEYQEQINQMPMDKSALLEAKHMNNIYFAILKPWQLLLPKKMERTCAWTKLYLEINDNYNDIIIIFMKALKNISSFPNI